MKLLRSALVSIGVANVSTRCLAQTCQEIVTGGGSDRKLEFLKEEAGGEIYGVPVWSPYHVTVRKVTSQASRHI
jgi:hypothetical protein